VDVGSKPESSNSMSSSSREDWMDAMSCPESSSEWLGDGLLSMSSSPRREDRRGWGGSTEGVSCRGILLSIA